MDLKLALAAILGLFLIVLFTGGGVWVLTRASVSERYRNAFLVLCLLGASIFISLVFLEVFTRIWFSDVTTTADNGSYFARRWYADNPMSGNSLGFREREISPVKSPGTFRIAVIGDSMTFGQGIDESVRFTNVLERRLNAGGRHFEVLNFGQAGAETVDHLEFLKSYVLPLRPDFILLQWYTNDVEGHDKSGRPWTPDLVPIRAISEFLHRHSALYFVLNRQWKNLMESWGIGAGYSQIDYIRSRFGDPGSKDSLEAQAALEQFISLAAGNNIPMGMVLFPRMDPGLARDDWPYAFLMERVLDTCRRDGLVCVDLRPVFGTVEDISTLYASRFDGHPNARANGMAADELLRVFGPVWRAEAQSAD